MKSAMFRLYRSLTGLTRGSWITRSPVARALHDFLYRLLKPRSASVSGMQIQLNPQDHVIADALILKGTWEPFESSVFLERLHQGAIVVDVGANIGYYTILAARAVGPRGKVFALEPDPENLSVLNQNVRKNDMSDRIVVIPAAAADTTATTQLYLSEENTGDHRIYKEGSGERRSVQVKTVKIDECIPKGSKVDFVKIDVQGAEAKVLRGMPEVLARSSNLTMLIEFSMPDVRAAGDDPRECVLSLARMGFSFRYVNEEKKKLEPMTPDEVLALSSGNFLVEREH